MAELQQLGHRIEFRYAVLSVLLLLLLLLLVRLGVSRLKREHAEKSVLIRLVLCICSKRELLTDIESLPLSEEAQLEQVAVIAKAQKRQAKRNANYLGRLHRFARFRAFFPLEIQVDAVVIVLYNIVRVASKLEINAKRSLDHDLTLRLAGLAIPAPIVTTWIVLLFIAIVCYGLTYNLKLENISKRQAIVEAAVTSLINFVTETFDGNRKMALKLLPVLAADMVLILCCNYSGLIPGVGMLPGLIAPTSTISVTLALSLVTFVGILVLSFQHKGLGYFKEFTKPYVFMLPLNIIDELFKPVSLALRLFGSTYAEEILLISVFNMFPLVLPVPFYFISLFFGAIQAYIFTFLTSTYFNHAFHEEEEEVVVTEPRIDLIEKERIKI